MNAWLIGYFIFAAVCGSSGYMLGAIMCMSKVGTLNRRLEQSERALLEQQQMVRDHGNALRLILLELDRGAASSEVVDRAQRLIDFN